MEDKDSGEQTAAERPIRVLAVDDERDVRHSLRSWLEERGCEVAEASDGEEAVRILQSGETPDILITDLIMPHMDGFQLIEHVQQSERLSELPFVVMASKGSDNDAMRKWLDSKPFPHILIKPFTNLQLGEIVDRLAEPRRPAPALDPDTRLARILLIDPFDEETIQRVARYLRVRGHEVVLPADYSDLIAAFDSGLPDVLVMPIIFFGTDSISELTSVRARPGGEQVGVIFISYGAEYGGAFRMWSMPIDSYVTRPYSAWQLLVAIEQLLYRHVITDEADTKASIAFDPVPHTYAERDAQAAMNKSAEGR